MQSSFGCIGYLGKKSLSALYPTYGLTSPNPSRYFKTFWLKKPAMIPKVVGKLAAHTPCLFIVCSSPLLATTNGGAQAKQAVSPGTRNYTWPDMAFSLTPDSNQI